MCTLSVREPPQTVAITPTLGGIVRAIPEDLWRFLSLDTVVVLSGGGLAAGVAHVYDDDLANEVEVSVRLNDALAPGHTYGAFAFQAVLGVALYTVGRSFGNLRLSTSGADIMRVQILSQAWVQTIKYSVQRERPDASDHYSFPSGHTASGIATAAVLGRHYGWKVGVPAFALAGYVAFARVKDNRHYLSDVVFGGAMGLASERTVTFRSRRYAVAVAPVAGTARAGITVTIASRDH